MYLNEVALTINKYSYIGIKISSVSIDSITGKCVKIKFYDACTLFMIILDHFTCFKMSAMDEMVPLLT